MSLPGKSSVRLGFLCVLGGLLLEIDVFLNYPGYLEAGLDTEVFIFKILEVISYPVTYGTFFSAITVFL